MVQFVTCSLVVLHRVSGEKVLFGGIQSFKKIFWRKGTHGCTWNAFFFKKIKGQNQSKKKIFFSLVWWPLFFFQRKRNLFFSCVSVYTVCIKIVKSNPLFERGRDGAVIVLRQLCFSSSIRIKGEEFSLISFFWFIFVYFRKK